MTSESNTVPTGPVASRTGLEGRWEGQISIANTTLSIVVNFSQDGDQITGAIDIPQQGAAGIPLHDITFDPPKVHFEMLSEPRLAVFDGELAADGSMAGSFTQSGFEGTFQLAPAAAQAVATATAPAEPLPYTAEDVTFQNGDVTLAGTLTIPAGPGPHPAVILVSGSGAQNRDEEIPIAPGYRPFAAIADALTRQGIAVLRYDDRGVGGSTGASTTDTSEDFATDVESALTYLQGQAQIDPQQIGILGHSEGGLIAAMVAARNPQVAFIILMAGPAESGYRIVLAQTRLIAQANGATGPKLEDIVAQETQVLDTVRSDQGWDALEAMLRSSAQESVAQMTDDQKAKLGDVNHYIDAVVAQQMAMLRSPWYRFFISYDPAQDLEKVKVPVLALYGGLDLQVPAEENKEALATALQKADNQDVTIQVFPQANHLFQEAKTGSPSEYAQLSPQFVPGFLDTITQWLLDHVHTSG